MSKQIRPREAQLKSNCNEKLRSIKDDILIAEELHYPDIVIKLLKEEPDANKRQHILHDARMGVYDGPVLNAKDTARMKHAKGQTKHCQDCKFYICEENMLKGYCNHPSKKETVRKWGSRAACKKLFTTK